MSHSKIIDEIFDEIFPNMEDNQFYNKFVDENGVYKIPPAVSTNYYSSRNFKINFKEVVDETNGYKNIRTQS